MIAIAPYPITQSFPALSKEAIVRTVLDCDSAAPLFVVRIDALPHKYRAPSEKQKRAEGGWVGDAGDGMSPPHSIPQGRSSWRYDACAWIGRVKEIFLGRMVLEIDLVLHEEQSAKRLWRKPGKER